MLLLNKRIPAFIVLILSLAAAGLWAQPQALAQPAIAQQAVAPPGAKPAAGAQADDSGAIFRSDTRVVVCPTTVVAKDGHLITDLPKSAFTVYENKVAQNFTMKREDVPVSLGLIIDTSSTSQPYRQQIADAAVVVDQQEMRRVVGRLRWCACDGS